MGAGMGTMCRLWKAAGLGGYERAMSALSVTALCSLGGLPVVLHCPCTAHLAHPKWAWAWAVGALPAPWLGPRKGGKK